MRPPGPLNELETAREMVNQDHRESGEPVPMASARRRYSGQFNVRIDKRVHRALAIEAQRAGVSFNALVAQKLARGVEDPGGPLHGRHLAD